MYAVVSRFWQNSCLLLMNGFYTRRMQSKYLLLILLSSRIACVCRWVRECMCSSVLVLWLEPTTTSSLKLLFSTSQAHPEMFKLAFCGFLFYMPVCDQAPGRTWWWWSECTGMHRSRRQRVRSANDPKLTTPASRKRLELSDGRLSLLTAFSYNFSAFLYSCV